MRLIDADAFKAYCKGGMDAMEQEGIYTKASLKQAREVTAGFCLDIDEQPTIDAVPVIRCKDCKWSNLHTQQVGVHLCKCGLNSDSIWLNADEDFCSWAERREE